MKAVLRRFLTWPVGVTFVLTAIVFGVLGWAVPAPSPFEASRYEGASLRLSVTGSPLIHPLLTCDIGSQDVFTDLTSIKNQLRNTIGQAERSGGVESVSVYFRDVRDAHWFDINPQQAYAPASLLKVFVMMAYYKASETDADANLLDQKYLFKASSNPNAEEPGYSIPQLTDGQYYTARQLISQMIVYSDNDALNTLVNNADPITLSALDEVFSDLQIPSPFHAGQQIENYMGVDQYATVFRVLSGASYLSRYDSEQALELLSKAHYNKALSAGVPSDVTVSHKFGVSPGVNEQNPELHDCGIVYYPQHAYLLCVMSRGSDYTTLQNLIKTMSAQVYADWQQKYPVPTSEAPKTTASQ